MNWFEKLKVRWGISSNWQIVVIFIVFAVTGSSTMKVSRYVVEFVGLNKDTTAWYYFWPLRILLITPIYQVLLLFFGFISFQFPFFWKMEKKMLRRFGLKLDKDVNEQNAEQELQKS
jgi:manganese efflux pump family protein